MTVSSVFWIMPLAICIASTWYLYKFALFFQNIPSWMSNIDNLCKIFLLFLGWNKVQQVQQISFSWMLYLVALTNILICSFDCIHAKKFVDTFSVFNQTKTFIYFLCISKDRKNLMFVGSTSPIPYNLGSPITSVTAQKIRIPSVNMISAVLITFTEEILHGKLHFL